MNYNELLDNAYEQLSSKEVDEERFKIPEIESLVQGKKTIIKNLGIVAKTLHRDPNHLTRHFTKETGVPCSFDGQKLVLNGNFNSFKISTMYKKYVDDFVVCKQCSKPDTKISGSKGVLTMKCEACGAINPIRKI